MEKRTPGSNATELTGTEVALERIQRNPFQPRKNFDSEELELLTPASSRMAFCNRWSFVKSASSFS